MIIVRQQPPEVVIIMTGAKQKLEFRSCMTIFLSRKENISKSKSIAFLEILIYFIYYANSVR